MGYKIRMLVEVVCEEYLLNLAEPVEMEWFYNDVLMNHAEDRGLHLHSDEIGDGVGPVRVLEVCDWPPTEATK